MALSVTLMEIDGLKLVAGERRDDDRGCFTELYSARTFAALGIEETFVQDNHTMSREAGTVRGMHFQMPPHAQSKLIFVLRGRIMDICVDVRRESRTYGRHAAVELAAGQYQALFVPSGFAHGYCTLDPDVELLYKVSDFYAPSCEAGFRWDDPALGVNWPDCAGAHVSAKDAALPLFADLTSPFVWS